MRAVIYARYSTELQRDASIEDQVRLCRARIDDEGWLLLSTYTDHAVSGSSRLRPGYQKLLEDARAAAFDVVVAEALDRLSRDQEDTAALYKHLSFAGVRLLTLAEGEISELHVGLKGTMNALFLKDLALKTRRGLEGRVRQGLSGGGLCYGYRTAPVTDAAGHPIRGHRLIEPAEAEIVRRIFHDYAAAHSPREIARRLNEERVPGPGGRPWGDTTIRGHALRGTGLLHNELYIGRLVWNRQRYVKDPATCRRVARLNPRSAWIIHEVPELRIVDDALWASVQARLGAARDAPGVAKAIATEFWKKRRPRHLLTGLVHCGDCGGLLAAVGRDYLACGAARRQGMCGNRRGIRRAQLETTIIDALRSRLMQPELVAEFADAYQQDVNRRRAGADAARDRMARELIQVERKLGGLIEAIAGGLRAPTLQRTLDDLEGRRAELERELATAPASLPRLHPNLSELYRRKVAELGAALRHPDAAAQALDIMRSLIERVTVRTAEDGYEIELEGALAGMLALAQGGAASGVVPETFRSSVEVVAGAGFEPATFRL